MKRHAFLVAGTSSGSGKTTVTLGLMAALNKRGHSVVPFKCGPDFIDPSLHKLVTGRVSRNLDIWMAGRDFSTSCFANHSRTGDVAVIEGVMGMFDGGKSSSAALATALNVPLILVVDVRSAAESVAAVLKGFETFDPEIRPRGVILNMVGSARHLQLVSEAITRHCQTEILGYLPRTIDFTLPSRHLGLHMGEEIPITEEKVDTLAEAISSHIHLDRLLEIAEVDDNPAEDDSNGMVASVKLGVARDRAFCFYYEDNLEIFRRAGAQICTFSPLEDEHLPPGIQGIYLGGGYPELYGDRLSANKNMLEQIHSWATNGKPIYAECGGFMYLTEGITDLQNRFHELAGVYPTRATMQSRRASLGYRQLTTRQPSFFGPAGTTLRGHEFHYSRIEPLDKSIQRLYDVSEGGDEGYRYKNVVGGYMHLHFGYNHKAAHHFIQSCRES